MTRGPFLESSRENNVATCHEKLFFVGRVYAKHLDINSFEIQTKKYMSGNEREWTGVRAETRTTIPFIDLKYGLGSVKLVVLWRKAS